MKEADEFGRCRLRQAAAKEEAEAEAAMKVGTLWWSILKTVNAAHLIPFFLIRREAAFSPSSAYANSKKKL